MFYVRLVSLALALVVSAPTVALAALPTSPNPLQGRAISPTSLSLSWSNSMGEDSYLLYRWTGRDWVFVTSISRDITSFNVSGLSPSTKYYYIIGAYNVAGVTWSDGKEFSTSAADVRVQNVPFLSQLSATCSPNYLCQYACASMLAGK